MSFLYRNNNNMIMISRTALSNTGVTKSYLTNNVPRNVSKLCAIRLSSPMYNNPFFWWLLISRFYISARKFIFYNEFHSHVKKLYTVIVLLTCKNSAFYWLIIQRVVLLLMMASQNDGVFYGLHSNRNLVATK
jgi:hypothetical protein